MRTNMCIILIYVMLAILSRKHFSKYKGLKFGFIIGFFYSIAENIYIFLEKRTNFVSLRKRIRSLNVVSEKTAIEMTKNHVIKAICFGLLLVFGFNLVSTCVGAFSGTEDDSNIVEREDYLGRTKETALELSTDEKTIYYDLAVEPIEYTETELVVLAEELFERLPEEILNGNKNLNEIRSDLALKNTSDNGIFVIRWRSDDVDTVSSYGKIIADGSSLPAKVTLTAQVSYQDFMMEHNYELYICEPNSQDDFLEGVKSELASIERNNRNSKKIILPKEYNGVKITLKSKNKNISNLIILFGILLGCISVFLDFERMKEKHKERDSFLVNEYPGFVNKLWLLTGTGMNVKDALKKIVKENRNRTVLIKEIEYTINQIDTGFNEAMAYEELGARIGIVSYVRLMNFVSQNIQKGNKDLRRLMEEEVYFTLNERKEAVRKKGETISTKLLFPMILLLGIVMVIVMFPAMTGF